MALSEEDHQRWETTRQHKRKYILTHGVLMWTLVGMAFYVIELDFSVERFTWLGCIIRLLASAAVGLGAGYLSYQRRERIYQRKIKDQS